MRSTASSALAFLAGAACIQAVPVPGSTRSIVATHEVDHTGTSTLYSEWKTVEYTTLLAYESNAKPTVADLRTTTHGVGDPTGTLTTTWKAKSVEYAD